MKLKVLTHTATLLEEEAAEIIFPGEDGEFSVMDFHQPCIYGLRPGQIKVRSKRDKKITKIPVKKGVVRIEPLRTVALIETTEQ